ncbi:DUF3176 containing protein [Pyrenophora tritici-repentis]|uniref:DUF3176 containing protein n=1 Tax=Pyrenophora tritici-repentis TaxID=45151 RepID=A0A922N3L2_9PLEO|nr:DUF3176 containing protein [Pyrenophora tritici-repentis]KAI1684569.1 DUF3176 containing protein [Pyrenophora tritici-repentis]
MEYSLVHPEPISRISTPTKDAKHQPRPSRSARTSLRAWKWELATWLLGTTALCAIVTLLILYRDKPLKEWTANFRLATAIAALSQVAQSALLVSVSSCIGQLKWSYLRKERSTLDISRFEQASRGPQGSLMLLLSIHPFSIKGTFSSTSATIGRSVQYVNDATNASFVEVNGVPPSSNPIMYHPHMAKGILAGILDDVSNPSDVIGSCQAEVCTWAPYQTLTVCSFVEDVSADGTMLYVNSMGDSRVHTHINLDWQIRPGISIDSRYQYCVMGHNNEEYCVGDADITEWEYLIAESLTGAAAVYPNETSYGFTGQYAPNIASDVLGDSPAYCTGSEAGGFEQRINNIAISMSNTLRTGKNAVPIKGTEWTKEQFFDVTFYWLSFPLAIYLTITLFLFSTIVTSGKADMPLWKSSQLVLLQATNSSNRMQSLDQVELEARSTRVKL